MASALLLMVLGLGEGATPGAGQGRRWGASKNHWVAKGGLPDDAVVMRMCWHWDDDNDGLGMVIVMLTRAAARKGIRRGRAEMGFCCCVGYVAAFTLKLKCMHAQCRANSCRREGIGKSLMKIHNQ